VHLLHETVQHADAVAVAQEFRDEMAADETHAAGDEYQCSHAVIPCRSLSLSPARTGAALKCSG